MLDPQNFSVYANSPTDIFIDIDPDDEITLSVGDEIVWCMYEQQYGAPKPDVDPVIVKNNADGGTIVVVDPDTQKLKVPLEAADTVNLLRNYYHECTVNGQPVANGIATVLGSENR